MAKVEDKAEDKTGQITVTQVCEFKAYIGREGELVIEANTMECQKRAIDAAYKFIDIVSLRPTSIKDGETIYNKIIRRLLVMPINELTK